MSATATDNPCRRCGACCASFRVDFAIEEWAGAGGPVPEGLAEPVTTTLCRLRGTDHASPRCAALVGPVGGPVHCGIHEWRPSPCREFGARAPMGIGDDACDRARRRHGLPPLQPVPATLSYGLGRRRDEHGCGTVATAPAARTPRP